jgi:hypothetical protein
MSSTLTRSVLRSNTLLISTHPLAKKYLMKYFSTILSFLGILNENFKEEDRKKKKRR